MLKNNQVKAKVLLCSEYKEGNGTSETKDKGFKY